MRGEAGPLRPARSEDPAADLASHGCSTGGADVDPCPQPDRVRLQTAAVNAVRGLAKPCGYRLPASSTLCFAKRCMAVLPPGLAQALGPVLEQIAAMTV